MPGVKKFRLSKRKSTSQLKVCIPLCLVESDVAEPGTSGKYKELNLALRSKVLPSGWTLVKSTEVVLAKSMYIEKDEKVITTFSVVIKEGFCWDVVLPYGVSIPKASHLFQQHNLLDDVDQVISVLHELDAPICVGNGDEKFHALKQYKAGRFLGRSKQCTELSLHVDYYPCSIKIDTMYYLLIPLS